jgi:lipopolysaccharide transport system ATP-binding protein
MQDISREGGRTVLFVSHNMAAVKSLCTRGIVMENGKVKFDGNIDEALYLYNSDSNDSVANVNWSVESAPGNISSKITSVKITSEGDFFNIENDINIEVEYVNFIDNHSVNVSISIFDDNDVYVLASPNLKRIPLEKGKYKSICTIPANFLNKGKYFCTVLLVGNNFEIIAQLDKIVAVELGEEGGGRKGYFGHWGGVVRPYLNWENIRIQ